MGLIVILQIKKSIYYGINIGKYFILLSYTTNIENTIFCSLFIKKKKTSLLYHRYRKTIYYHFF